MRTLRMNRLALVCTMMFLRRGICAFTPSRSFSARQYHASPSLLQRRSSWGDDDEDEWGGQRIIRKRDDQDRRRDSWGDNDDSGSRGRPQRGPRNDFNRNDYDGGRGRDRRGPRNDRNRDRGDWRRGRDDRGGDRRRRNKNDDRRDRNGPSHKGRRGKAEDPSSKIDMKGLEAEGFVHLYGLAPILSALKSNRRDFSPRQQEDDILRTRFGEDYNEYDEDDNAFDSGSEGKTPTKPEAQYTPWLFLQDRSTGGGSERRADKVAAAEEVKQLAEELEIPIAHTDKGALNSLCGNRPHQGFVLRCGALEFEPIGRIPLPDPEDPSIPNLWLVLDEVVDPQNLGALLRSSYFLGGNNNNRLGIVVCSKNSAPPSPAVSAASAGALELLDVYSTSSLPRTLASAREDGFRIIGAASSKPRSIEDDESIQIYDLQNLPLGDDRPTLLVLGSEGHGLRTLVAKLCTDFVRIPRGDGEGTDDDDNDEEGGFSAIVDSLNVSVTGGILLWHLLYGSKP